MTGLGVNSTLTGLVDLRMVKLDVSAVDAST